MEGFLKQFNNLFKIGLIVIFLTVVIFPNQVNADDIDNQSDTLSRIKQNTDSNHTIKFVTPTGAGDNTDTITVIFPAGFDVSTIVSGDIDLSHGAVTGYENEETVSNPATATDWGADFGGTQTLTLTHPTDGANGDISMNDIVVIEIGTNAAGGTHQITNPLASGIYTVTISGLFGDQGSMQLAIIDNDQVQVTATVDEGLTFTMTGTSVTLTRAGGGNPDFAHTGFNNNIAQNEMTAATNTPGGYTITYNGHTLESGIFSINAKAGGVSNIGTEEFGINLRDNATPNMGADPAGGTGVPAADYNTVDQYKFVHNNTTLVASAAAATDLTTYTISYLMNVSGTTEASIYSTTITYICTAVY